VPSVTGPKRQRIDANGAGRPVYPSSGDRLHVVASGGESRIHRVLGLQAIAHATAAGYQWIRRSVKGITSDDVVRAEHRSVVAAEAEHRTGVAADASRGDQRAGRVSRGNVSGKASGHVFPGPHERLTVAR